MRVMLVGAEVEENLALRYLWSALERAGHQVGSAVFDSPDDGPGVLEAARRQAPDLIGLSITFQRRAHEFGELAAALRQAGFAGHITSGGHFPTFAHRELLERYPAIDSAVRHEGEETLPALCAAIEGGGDLAGIRGLAFRREAELVVTPPRPLCPDLDALPFPRRPDEPPVHLGIPTAFLVGSRGCYGHCTFCCINAWINEAGGPRYRERSVESLVDEMELLRRERGVRLFIFHDDDFFTRDRARDLARVTGLRDQLRRRGLKDLALVVKARPDDVDGEVFRVLREIGLLRVYLGIETASSQGLRTLGRGVDQARNRAALAQLLELGLYACFNLLLFDPDSTVGSLEENVRFLREAAAVPMNFCRTEIYVGTPLHKRMAREGRLRGDSFGWDYTIADPRAEVAFRLFARAFHDRNFRPDGLMNSNLGLGYHLHLLRHFYPRAVTPALLEAAEQTVTRVNLDCVSWLEQILDFARSDRALDPAAVEGQGEWLAAQLARANRDLEAQVDEATRAIIDAARGSQAQTARRISRWRALAAATLVLPLAACPSRNTALPPDPPPPPHADMAGPPPPPPPDPVPPPRIMPPDPPPPPHDSGPRPRAVNPGDPPPPPPDPVPPPRIMPPDPPPPPHVRPGKQDKDKKKKKDKKKRPPPPPDPVPPPHRKGE